MMLFHTSELRDPTTRALHAAWFELKDCRLLMPRAVAEQLAPTSAGAIGTGTNLAAALLEHRRMLGPMHSDARLAEEAWWWKVWNDDSSPYRVVPDTPYHRDQATRMLHEIDPRGFPGCRPDEVHRSAEALIVCETIALEGWLCLRTNINVIDQVEINRWAVEAGHRGKNDGRVLYDTDSSLLECSYHPENIQRLVQAGLLACWPADDGAPAAEVLRSTRRHIGAMTLAGRLPMAGQRLLNCLNNHPDPIGLVEETRELLPSATVDAERLHPRHHVTPPAPPRPPEPPATSRHAETRDSDAG